MGVKVIRKYCPQGPWSTGSLKSHIFWTGLCVGSWIKKKKILCCYKISSPAASSSSGVHPLLRCPFLKVLVFSVKMLQSIQMRCLAHSSLRLCFCLWALLFHFDLLSHFLNRSSYDSCYVWRVSRVAALSTLQLKGFLSFVPCICSISNNYWDVLLDSERCHLCLFFTDIWACIL